MTISATDSPSEAYLTINLDLKDPVEIHDFSEFFESVASRFDEYMALRYPDLQGRVQIYVQEVRKGSIIADIAPHAPDLIELMEAWLIVSGFAGSVAHLINRFKAGRSVPDATKSDLEAVTKMVKSVSKDSEGKATIETVRFSQGVWTTELVVSFDTAEAKKAQQTAERELAAIAEPQHSTHHRVLMIFERPSIRDVKPGKSTGERVIIDEIDAAAKPLVYGSDLAEDQLKDFMRNSPENIFKKGFIVDVSARHRDGRLIAYNVTELHQIIDLTDDAV